MLSELTEVAFYASDMVLLPEECVLSLLTEVAFYASDTVLFPDE